MEINVGCVSVNGNEYDVWVSDQKIHALRANRIILSESIMDRNWIQDIRRLAIKTNDVFLCDDKNARYVKLYVLFSLKRKLTITDILSVYCSTQMDVLPTGKNLQDYLWNSFSQFLSEHNYKIFFLGRVMLLSQGKGRLNAPFYDTSRWNLYGLVNFCKIASNYMGRKLGVQWNRINLRLRERHVCSRLTDVTENLHRLNPSSESGCLFFRGIRKDQELFIKAGVSGFSDISDESNAIRMLKEKSRMPQLYMLSMQDDLKNEFIIYPYIRDDNLETLRKKRILNAKESRQLLLFAKAVLEDLDDCNIIHRDVKPDNILVHLNQEGEIEKFLLADFGCASINKQISNKSLFARRKNRYAGSSFRFGDHVWDDAASFAIILLEYVNWETISNCDLIRKIFSLIQTNVCGK